MINWLYRWAPSFVREFMWKRRRNDLAFRYAALGYRDPYTRANAEMRERWPQPWRK